MNSPLDLDYIRSLQPLLHQAAEGHRIAVVDCGADPKLELSSRAIYSKHIAALHAALLQVIRDQVVLREDAIAGQEPAMDRQIRELFTRPFDAGAQGHLLTNPS